MSQKEWDYRFGGIQRSYGIKGSKALQSSHVLIIGLGGVGSWAAEALVRTGVGKLSLVDFDDICLSNSNRQIQATTPSVGKMKTSVLKQRFLSINPEIDIVEHQEMYDANSGDAIFRLAKGAVIVDCMDLFLSKCFLINQCYQEGRPLVVVGGSAGKTSPEKIQISDLSQTHGDRLLHRVRKRLRQQYGFPRDIKKKWNISAVYSAEAPVFPMGDGSVSREVDARPTRPMDCNDGMGSLGFVTGSFGFFAASEAVKLILKVPLT